jgi:hypothetical protein
LDLYDRKVSAINYLKKIGKFRFVNDSDGNITVHGNVMLWSSGGWFKSSTIYYIINPRKRTLIGRESIANLV